MRAGYHSARKVPDIVHPLDMQRELPAVRNSGRHIRDVMHGRVEGRSSMSTRGK